MRDIKSGKRFWRVNARSLILLICCLLVAQMYTLFLLKKCYVEEDQLLEEARSHTGSADGQILPDSFFAEPRTARPAQFMAKRKWRRVDRENALFLWMGKDAMPWAELHRDQIPNHLYFERDMTNKGELLKTLDNAGYDSRQFLPETYRMWLKDEREEFFEVVKDGITFPWLLKLPHKDKGSGIFPLTNAEELQELKEKLAAPDPPQMMAQRYVDDPVLLNKRKFDLRIYWLVASVDPLIVLYRDGTLRVSLSEYKGGKFEKDADGKTSLGAHLTNAIVQKTNKDYAKLSEQSRASFEDLEVLLAREFPDRENPLDEVRCQIQSALVACIQAARDRNVDATTSRVRNAYSLLGADFMIDKNLHLWMSEVQSGPGLPMGTEAVRKVMESMLPEMLDIVQEIRAKQNAHHPVLPLDSVREFVPIVLDRELRAPACPGGKPTIMQLKDRKPFRGGGQ